MEDIQRNKRIRTAVISGLIFGVFMGFYNIYTDNLKAGIIKGAISGVLYGVMSYFLFKPRANSKLIEPENQAEINGREV